METKNRELIIVVCTWLSVAVTTQAAPLYHLTALGSLGGGDDSSGYAINDSSQIVGESLSTPTTTSAFLWSPSSGMQNLGMFNGDIESLANGVSNNGEVVGESISQAPVRNHAFAWTSSGGLQSLGPLAGDYDSVAYGVNNTGQVVGYSVGDGPEHAVLWTASGVVQNLPALSTTNPIFNADALSINNNGVAAGVSGYEACIWTNGSVQGLGYLPGGNQSEATGINDLGQVVGEATTSTGAVDVCVWSSGSGMRDLGNLPGLSYLSDTVNDQIAINNLGEIVAYRGSLSSSETWVWTSNSGWVNLSQSLDSSGNGWSLWIATGINDSGQIVGAGFDPYGGYEAVLLTPVPKPPSIVLVALGTIGLLLGARNRRNANAV